MLYQLSYTPKARRTWRSPNNEMAHAQARRPLHRRSRVV
jgi:hypothetical protein